jgi:hypothetical protein
MVGLLPIGGKGERMRIRSILAAEATPSQGGETVDLDALLDEHRAR